MESAFLVWAGTLHSANHSTNLCQMIKIDHTIINTITMIKRSKNLELVSVLFQDFPFFLPFFKACNLGNGRHIIKILANERQHIVLAPVFFHLQTVCVIYLAFDRRTVAIHSIKNLWFTFFSNFNLIFLYLILCLRFLIFNQKYETNSSDKHSLKRRDSFWLVTQSSSTHEQETFLAFCLLTSRYAITAADFGPKEVQRITAWPLISTCEHYIGKKL